MKILLNNRNTLAFLLGLSVLSGGILQFDKLFAADVEAYFSPDGNCAARIIKAITSSKESIYVQAYSFTSPEILEALIQSHKFGVEVKVLLDKSHMNDTDGVYRTLKAAGVWVKIDGKHAIAHNKIIIVDKKILFTGSYNFTRAAETRNAENFVVITRAKEVLEKFVENWQLHSSHSF